MKKQLNYTKILLEMLILTVAVAIIAAAVYFFLVPSHTSVSSISGLGIVLIQLCTTASVCHHHDPECGSSDHWLSYLWKGIRSKNRLHQYHASCFSGTF